MGQEEGGTFIKHLLSHPYNQLFAAVFFIRSGWVQDGRTKSQCNTR